MRDLLNVSSEEVAFETTRDIINRLPPKALSQLLEGYNQDIDMLLEEIKQQAYRVIALDEVMSTVNLNYVEDVKTSMDLTFKKLSYNYFKTTMLPNFHQGWRNLEWGNLVQLYTYLGILAARSHGKSFEWCFAFPLWRLYSYDRPNFIQKETIDNKNRKETCIITNTSTLGELHLDKIIEEIKLNDLLREKLNPNNKATLNKTGVVTETGSTLHLRGKDGFIRGLHVGAVVCDDLPDDSSIYSNEQRGKLLNTFKGAIKPIVEPYGFLTVSGTPFHADDLYNNLKEDKSFKVFEYPAIFPDGRMLSPDRFTYEKLQEERASVGSLVFAREYLVVPISDDSTIFPYEFLKRSVEGMEGYTFVDNIESSFKRMKKVVMGCDFARSANVGADYTVFSVWGLGEDDNYYLLNLYRERGMSYDQQINQIMSMARSFRPDVIVCENNGFQNVFVDMLKRKGLGNIKPFTTTSNNKKNLRDGLPSLAALFEGYRIKIPYSHDRGTRELVDIMFSEFNSIAFRGDKDSLESVGGHDDTVMSSFFAITELRSNSYVVKIDLI